MAIGVAADNRQNLVSPDSSVRRRQLRETIGSAPWWLSPVPLPRLGLAIAVLTALLTGYLLGADGSGEATRLRGQVEELQAEKRVADEQLARLQAEELVDREAYRQIEEQMADLQGQLIEQQEELAFYRGIVRGPGEAGLSVRDLSLASRSEGIVQLRFTIAQPAKAERQVSGRLQLRLEGVRNGAPASMDVAQLLIDASMAQPSFNFRYFEDIALELRIPEDFDPQRVIIRVVPATRGVKASVESFPWPAAGA